MSLRAATGKIRFRPHFKTHQSAGIGECFRQSGVRAITVSSVRMAEYFADHGWDDITIAFPVNILEIEEINDLASNINLHLLIESAEVASFLSDHIRAEVSCLIKIDTGYHRTGVDPENIPLIDHILEITRGNGYLKFEGFLTHTGQTYSAKSLEEIREIRDKAVHQLSTLKEHYSQQFPGLIISYGDTPSCSLPDPLPEVDEIRPGNFVFYDLMQYHIGSCRLEDIAVAVACPVVAVHPSRNEAVLYGGAVHLSKESWINGEGMRTFGLAVKLTDQGWDIGRKLGYLSALSQEHGILKTDGESGLKPGDLLAILPVHSCLTTDLLQSDQLIF